MCPKIVIISISEFTRYLNAIQTMCPHILRYLTTAVITNKRRRTVLKDLVKVIQQVSSIVVNNLCTGKQFGNKLYWF